MHRSEFVAKGLSITTSRPASKQRCARSKWEAFGVAITQRRICSSASKSSSVRAIRTSGYFCCAREPLRSSMHAKLQTRNGPDYRRVKRLPREAKPNKSDPHHLQSSISFTRMIRAKESDYIINGNTERLRRLGGIFISCETVTGSGYLGVSNSAGLATVRPWNMVTSSRKSTTKGVAGCA